MSDNSEKQDKICCLGLIEKSAILLVLTGFAFWWWQIDSTFLQIAALSLLLLVIAMVTIWVFGIPVTKQNEIDLESFARDRIKATIAILAMATVLGVVSLIANGVNISNSEKQSQGRKNVSSVSNNPKIEIVPVIGGSAPRKP